MGTDKLLSDEELHDSIRDAITGIDTENENNLWTPGQIERLVNLFNTQKRLYGESVTGEVRDTASNQWKEYVDGIEEATIVS